MFFLRSTVCLAFVLALLGCGDDNETTTGGGGSGGAATTSTNAGSPTTTTKASGTTSASSVSSNGSTSTGETFCTPGSQQPCYSGPSGTEGVGACVGGTETCNEQGTAFGPCEGEVLPSVETCATPVDDDCDADAPVCTGDHVWSKRFGGVGSDLGRNVATDASNNVILAGHFRSSADFGGGPLTSAGVEDLYVVKLDPAGNHLWSKRFGDGSNQLAGGLAVDGAGNIIVASQSRGTIDFGGGPLTNMDNNDVFVAKLDPAGNHLWSKRFGDAAQQYVEGVAVDAAGNVIITGSSNGTLDFGGGPITSAGFTDVFVAKLDADGNHLWSKGFGDGSFQEANAVTVDAAGNILLTGSVAGTTDFGGGPLMANGVNAFLVKLDPSGAHLWSHAFGSMSQQEGRAIATDAAGNVYWAGDFFYMIDFGGGALTSAGHIDVFLAKLDSAGNHVWSKGFGSADYQRVSGLAIDADANLVLSGNFENTIDFGGGTLTSAGLTDAFVAKLDTSGNHAWSRRVGDVTFDRSVGATVDSASHVLVTGHFEGSADFGGGALVDAGAGDAFVAKLAP